MKRTLCLLLAALLLTSTACSTAEMPENTSDISPQSVQSEPTPQTTEEMTETKPSITIESFPELIKLDSVVSVDEIKLSNYKGFAAYEVIFESEGLNIQADIVAPDDYAEKNYPVIFYIPDINITPEISVQRFAAYNVAVVRLYKRAFGKSEGARDFGGTDFADITNIATALSGMTAFEQSKKILAGSSEGSIMALRAAAQTDIFDGCAVIDLISDLPSYIEARGDRIKDLFAAAIGGTLEEVPEEYSKRSAVCFADKLNIPILIMAYKDHPNFPDEQASSLHEKLLSLNKTSELHYIDELSSDLNESARRILFSWIRSVDLGQGENNNTESEKCSVKYTFKDNVSQEEQKLIIAEAEKAIVQANAIIGVELGRSFECIFDSKYIGPGGEARSEADWMSKTVYCRNYTSFVHEYIHMLLFYSPDFVSSPDKLTVEGTATYFEHMWREKHGADYKYLYSTEFPHSQNESEDKMLREMIEKAGFDINERHYKNAMAAYGTRLLGADSYKKYDQDFLNYDIGCIFVEYLIKECGGQEKFLGYYYDITKISELYSDDIDGLIKKALKYNSARFY